MISKNMFVQNYCRVKTGLVFFLRASITHTQVPSVGRPTLSGGLLHQNKYAHTSVACRISFRQKTFPRCISCECKFQHSFLVFVQGTQNSSYLFGNVDMKVLFK